MLRLQPALRFFSFARLVAAMLVFLSGLAARGEVIYDNTSHFLNNFFNEQTEYGDQVDLEGTARRLTQMRFEYFGRFAVDGDERVKVRLYANEKQYDRYRKEPTTLLFESDWMSIFPGYNTHTISGLNVPLPLQTVTFTVEFTGIAEDEAAGLLFYDPPTVGYSFNEVWFRGATGIWVPVLYSTSDPMKRASASLRLIAEPEALPDQRSDVAEVQLALREGARRIRFAQTFSPEVSGRLSHLVLSMQFTNLPVRVRILDTLANAPGPNVLGSINLLRGTGLPQTLHFFDQAIYLQAGRLYAIEISTAAEAATVPSYLLPASRNRYPRGHLWFRDEDAGSWTPATENFDHETYLDANFETHIIRAEPSAQLLLPRPGQTFELGEPIVLEARHRSAEIGAIARVRFLQGTNEIASLTNAPFRLTWTNATPGEHNLKAIADDTFRRPFRSEVIPIFVRAAGPPENDTFAARLALSGTVAQSTKPAAAATLQSGEPRSLPGYSGRTLWWSWTAYDASPVTISAQNSSAPDTSVAIYQGVSLETLRPVTNGISEVLFVPEPGRTYAIALEPKDSSDLVTLDIAAADVRVQRAAPTVARAGDPVSLTLASSPTRSITNVQLLAGTQLIAASNSVPVAWTHRFATNGSFDLRVAATDTRGIRTLSGSFPVVIRPRNDARHDAAPLTGFSASTDFSSEAATAELIDPVTFETNAHSIWYSWNAPADGVCFLTVPGRTPESFLGVYVLRSDIAQPTLDPIASAAGSGADRLQFNASAGTTYYLLVAADHPETGTLHLQLRPLNDAFAHRAHLHGQVAQKSFRLIGGSLEINEPAVPNLAQTNLSSAWWTWTAPTTGEARLEIAPPAGPVALAVFTGDSAAGLTLVRQATASRFLEFSAVEGNVYHLRIIGSAEEADPMNLALSMRGLRLVRPVDNQIFRSPAAVPLEFTFLGGIEEGDVEFLANETVLTNLAMQGASFLWTNPPPGVHELRVRAKSDIALASAPVHVIVTTNLPAFENRIFAGPFSSTSFILNESGETHVFGARPSNPPRLTHQDPFYPASLLSLPDTGSWPSFEANSNQYFALSAEGVLLTNGHPIFSPSDTQRWSRFSAGRNSFAAIGHDGELYLDALLPVAKPASVTRWTDVATASDVVLALADNGEIYFVEPQTGTILSALQRPAEVSAWTRIEAGARSALLLGDEGKLYSLNLEAPLASAPPALFLWNRPREVRSWTDFAAGGHHQLFLGNNGVLYASGRNLEGQLGIGRTSASEGMVRVPFPPGVVRWTHIAAGEFHSLAVGSDCRVYSWGSNAQGQLGLGRHVALQHLPARVETIASFCPPAPRIDRVAPLPNGEVALNFETILNRPNFIEYSDDLITWRRVAEEIPGDGLPATWIDSGEPLTPPHPRARFYRLARP
jgi:hypothetical protein